MDELLQLGNVAATDPKQRHEEVRVVRRNPDGTFRVDPFPFTIKNFCSSDISAEAVAQDTSIIAVIHNHISTDGEIAGCPGAEKERYRPIRQAGGSLGDYGKKAEINYKRLTARPIPQQPVAFFVIDPERAYYLPPMSTQGGREFKYLSRNAALNPGNCTWR